MDGDVLGNNGARFKPRRGPRIKLVETRQQGFKRNPVRREEITVDRLTTKRIFPG